MNIGRWIIMYCHAPFPPKPQWRIRMYKPEKHLYIDLGRVRLFRKGKGELRPYPARPVIPCEKTTPHGSHLWDHYDIDFNTTQQVWCTGDFLTIS